jgi:pyruvate dehydrogenase E1 component alpha subunit
MFLRNFLRAPSILSSPSLVGRRSFANENSKDIEVEFEVPFKTYLIDQQLPNSAKTNREELLNFYELMTLMRRLEVTSDQLYKSKLIRGFCHLYSGQEAVAAGMEAALTKEDQVITAYRDHANMLLRGATAGEVLAELLGKSNGIAKGKGGSMHMYKKSHNFYGGNGIVGAQVPLGAGLALAQQYLGTGRVSVALYGDGAANQGQVFEAYNMSALWKLPVIYICENNHYAMGTSVSRGSALTEYYKRGQYIPGIQIDGMNVLAVKTAMQYAVKHAQEKGPIVLEMDTYRYSGHSMSDPGTTYRTRDEIAKIRDSKDPVINVRNKLLNLKLATEDELKEVEKKVRDDMEEALKFAKDGKDPEAKELFTNIYSEPISVRTVELVNSFKP